MADNTSKLVFVYGTLKFGFKNYSVMQQASGSFQREAITDPEYSMINMGGFPAVIIGGDTSIHGEIFRVKSLKLLDRLEGYPRFYDRIEIQTPMGPAWMYVLSSKYHLRHPVEYCPDGWTKALDTYK